MEAESFFSRWARRKSEVQKEEQEQDALPSESAEPTKAGQDTAAEAQLPAPTMEDVAKLTHDSDFKPFVARGVDDNIRRSALKKLFTDPHFNVMDGLDIYIEDYNKFEPIPPEMLAMLEHAKSVLDPLGQLKKPVMALLDSDPEKSAAQDQQSQLEAQETQEAPQVQAEQKDQEGQTTAGNAVDTDPADTPHQAREDRFVADADAAQAEHSSAPEETTHNPEPPHDPIQSL